MDEVMAGLNPIEMEESIRFVKKVNQMGIAILFIEHVMKAVVNVCTRAIVINEGSFLSEGVPQEVLKEPAGIGRLYWRKASCRNLTYNIFVPAMAI